MPRPPHHHRGERAEWFRRLERRSRPTTTAQDRTDIRAFVLGTLTDDWFVHPPEIDVDDVEILIVGELDAGSLAELGPDERAVAESARLEAFREETRARRIEIAQRVEQRFERRVSWGARAGGGRQLFTTASAPVMTRLDMGQRRVLDTLVEAGVARSRSDALSWCVDLVAEHEDEWITRLREALRTVEEARGTGPGSPRS